MERNYSFLDYAQRGMYFSKKQYQDEELPVFEEVKEKLPHPFIAAKPEWTDCYWYAVRVLLKNIHKPKAESGFVSNFVDAAFNKDIFLWDTCFMTMFCNLFHPYVPGIRSLDNFYCKQFDDGEIPRELVRDTGKDFLLWVNAYDKPLYSYFHNHYGFRGLSQMKNLDYEQLYQPDLGRVVEKNPYLTLDNLNHPILALAEWESYCHTKDVERLHLVWEPLYQYYRALWYHLRHANGMFVTDWASMDNSPRNKYLGFGVDITCEMILFAGNLLDMLEVLERNGYREQDAQERRSILERERNETIEVVRRKMWNEEKGFFFDVAKDGRQCSIKTAAAFWALLSGAADRAQQEKLAEWLEDEKSFKRIHRVPVLAADEEGYNPRGGYWRGSVWAPMNAMIVMGLEKCKFRKMAKEIAMNHLDILNRVFLNTGTIWENYPADFISSGDADHADMVGWSGLAPILYLIRYGVGLCVSEGREELEWTLDEELLKQGSVGCKNYWFAGKRADLKAEYTKEGIHLSVKSEDSFSLIVRYGEMEKVFLVKKNLDTCLIF